MRPVDQSMGMECLQILPNRNLRGFETAGEIEHENATLAVQDLKELALRRSSLSKEILGQAVPACSFFLQAFFLYRLLSGVQSEEKTRPAKAGQATRAWEAVKRFTSDTPYASDVNRRGSLLNWDDRIYSVSPRNTSRTLRARACNVNGFCRKADSRFQDALMNNCIFGVSGEIQHFDFADGWPRRVAPVRVRSCPASPRR